MDPRLQQAAESGSIDELYDLIDENPYLLENIDAVPFVTTPLHVAASSGNIPFAMEMLNLKPSFARKLNTSGYSPLHLAVDKDKAKFVGRMLLLDKGLVRVKGRNGITPFLLLVSRGKADLVADQGPRVVGEDLDLEEVVANTGCKEAASLPKSKAMLDILKSPLTFSTFGSTFMRRQRSSTSDEARGVFLIVCTLIITATYQTALQPPGGVQKPEDTANASSEAMKKSFFMFLWASNTVGFSFSIHFEEHRTAAPEPRLSWFWKD
ncbi:hypothetical protein HID58_064037 [Brassica napus]|uniref:PGG domain-containing protein n=1 Tax=Brassica napus TaxID=3708 RepID=A0ABQ7Z951_BRANA|nr:hypothetical protein HID58_064037 [Brassica napus]